MAEVLSRIKPKPRRLLSLIVEIALHGLCIKSGCHAGECVFVLTPLRAPCSPARTCVCGCSDSWCGCLGLNKTRPFAKDWDIDVGEPLGVCKETSRGSGVYEREWSRAIVQWDCAEAHGKITAKYGDSLMQPGHKDGSVAATVPPGPAASTFPPSKSVERSLVPLQFFVDCEHGDDNADGRSARRPFRTLARAQRATRAGGGADANVFLAPGVCQLVGSNATLPAAQHRPWEISAADSGTSFEALDSAAEPPVISAGIRLKGTWTKTALHGGNIFSITVPGTAPIGKQLFWARGGGQPEQRQVLARAPNRPVVLSCASDEDCAPPYLAWQQTVGHWLPTKNAHAWNSTMPVGFQWNASEDSLFASLIGQEDTVHIGVGHSWTFSKHGIKAIQRNRTVLFNQGPPPDMWKVKGERYYLENALSLLDVEGEFFGDAATRTIYYWPPAGHDPNDMALTVSSLQQVLQVGTRSRDLRFTGLRFSHAEWMCQQGIHSAIECNGQAAWFLQMAAVEVLNATAVTFERCVVSHVGS